MAKEHSSTEEFKTLTYNILTSPAAEWGIVVEKRPISEEHKKSGRAVRDFAALLCSEKMKPQDQRAGLREEEIIAVILYSGPMVSFSP